MFTGIVEALGTVVAVQAEGTNRRLRLRAPFAAELRVDQSVAHEGVCLTVVAVAGEEYEVVAVDETLRRSILGRLQPGDVVNLERCLRVGDRLDGHFVQGHVDATTELQRIVALDGSWQLHFALDPAQAYLVVAKGSICLSGVSLTVVDALTDTFSVVIIPYTWGHTTLSRLKPGDAVNVEYDILGKYLQRRLELGLSH